VTSLDSFKHKLH